MNKQARYEALKAMDIIARSFNDEDLFMEWLTYGIEDECTDYSYYDADDIFQNTMTVFCNLMKYATQEKGALYIDGVLSR